MRETELRRSFSLDLWRGPVCDQKRSGRCWIFASLNPLRQKLCEKYGLADFRFSTNYSYFYDQLRKSRTFLEQMSSLRDTPLTDVSVSELLREPISSVGQWCYFAALGAEYGLVPLESMPDTEATADGTALTRQLSEVLRIGARRIRNGETAEETLAEIEAILREHLGTPPERFHWRRREYTPLSFLRDCVAVNLGDSVTLIHHPSERWPADRAYHEEADPARRSPYLTLLSVDMETLKALALRQLRDGEQVVIGCDVRHAGSRRLGELDTGKYGTSRLSKADAIAYREINACHVMSLDGWDAHGSWKVQDSHGTETGPDGHYVMSDAWFDAYVLSAVVKKKYLTPEQLETLNAPIYMPKTERF